MTHRVQIVISRPEESQQPGGAPPGLGPLSRLKFILAGIVFATVAIAILLVALIFGSILVAIIWIGLVVATAVLILKMAFRRAWR